MDSKIILGRILEKFIENKISKYAGYASFGYVSHSDNIIIVTREKGNDTKVPFKKILAGIEAYKLNYKLYEEGPTALREFGISHITSPVYSLLHLLEQKDYT